MNDAHLHLIVNHFPIIGTIIGTGILLVGIFKKNSTIKNVAYLLFIFMAIFAFASMYTGEGAEEFIEDLPTVEHKIIHEHEEMAEKLAMSLYLLGLISVAGLYTTIKKNYNSKLVSFLALVVAVVSVILAKDTGTTGGQIRHPEISNDFSAKDYKNDEE
jgi:uncharacterized membrane protein